MSKKTPATTTIHINHASVYAHDPERAARDLAAIVNGTVQPFHPCAGAWVCFLSAGDDWNGAFIEFYPRTVTLAANAGSVEFRELKPPATGAGTHFNLSIPLTRSELESLCDRRKLAHSWRDWQALLEVWLDAELLIECVPTTNSNPQ